MAITAERLEVEVGADTAEAERKLSNLGDEGGGGKWARNLALFGGAAFAAVGAAAAGMIGTGLSVAMDMEQAHVGFETMLGSAKAADAFLKQLKEFAATTPFEFPELQNAASRLVAVGTATERVIPLMTAIGDATAAMGTGAQGIDRAVTALTQMQQKGKVTGEEMLQLTEAGIPAWATLAASMGKTVPEVQALVTKGLVPADQIMSAIEGHHGPLKNLTGMMAEQAQTLGGMWSTLKDTVSMGLADMAAPIVQQVKGMMGPLTETIGGALETLGPVFAQVAGGLLTALQGLLPALVPLLGGIAGALAPLLSAIGPVLAGLMPALKTFADALVLIANAAAPIVAVLGQALAPVLGGIAGVVKVVAQTFGALVGALAPLFPVIVQVAETVGSFVGELARELGPELRQIASIVGGTLTVVLKALVPVIEPVLGVVGMLAGILARLLIPVAGLLSDVIKTMVPVVAQLAAAFIPLVEQLLGALAPVLQQVVGILGRVLRPVLEALAPILLELGARIFPVVAKVIEAVAANAADMAPVAEQLADAFLELIPALLPLVPPLIELVAAVLPLVLLFVQLQSTILGLILPALVAIMPAITGLVQIIVGGLVPVVERIAALFRGDFAAAFAGVGPILDAVGGWFAELPGKIGGFLAGLPGMLNRLALEAVTNLSNAVWEHGPAVLGFFAGLPARAANLLVDLGPQLVRLAWEAQGRLTRALWDALPAVLGFFVELPGRIGNVLAGLPGKMWDVGKSLVMGLWDGIKALQGWLVEQVTAWAKAVIPDPLEKFLKIASPSRLMADLGGQVGAGLAAGMAGAEGLVARASEGLAAAAAVDPITLAAAGAAVGVPLAFTAGATASTGGTGGYGPATIIVEVHNAGSVIAERDLVETVRDGLIEANRLNAGLAIGANG